MKKINQRGFGALELLLIIVAFGLIGGLGWYVYTQQKKPVQQTSTQTQQPPTITNFEECKAAGNPIMESFPEQCSASGQTFVNEKTARNELGEDFIVYGTDDVGVEIKQKSDVSKLEEASQGFKKFISDQVGEKPKLIDCSHLGVEDVIEAIHVNAIYKDESASGGIINCSGAPRVWKNIDNVWQAIGQQGDCDYFRSQDIPDVISRCS